MTVHILFFGLKSMFFAHQDWTEDETKRLLDLFPALSLCTLSTVSSGIQDNKERPWSHQATAALLFLGPVLPGRGSLATARTRFLPLKYAYT